MKIASVAEIKSQFSAFLKASAAGPIVVTRNGRPVAVIVGVQDEDEIERLLTAKPPNHPLHLARPHYGFARRHALAAAPAGELHRSGEEPT